MGRLKLMARAGARAYNGIWEQKPAGYMDRAPGQGVKDCHCTLCTSTGVAKLALFWCLGENFIKLISRIGYLCLESR